MSSTGKEAVVKRADALIDICGSGEDPTRVSESYNGALNLLRVVHGPSCS